MLFALAGLHLSPSLDCGAILTAEFSYEDELTNQWLPLLTWASSRFTFCAPKAMNPPPKRFHFFAAINAALFAWWLL